MPKDRWLPSGVTEPQWFANTYHRWTGADGDDTSDADHWSDYLYANAGTTYQTDAGAPQPSWTATMENTGASHAAAHGAVLLDNGTLASLRWVEVQEDASVTGGGTIDATLYHAGHRTLTISGDYVASPSATTDLTLAGTADPGVDYARLLINGNATVGGTLSANQVNGRYDHADLLRRNISSALSRTSFLLGK